MSRMELPFWVFASGEEGVHGLDWGIKHASSLFADRYELDARYRSLLKAFSLPPSLERPRSDVGLLLLPWQDGFLLGFIFPGNDLKGRPNISTVACIVTPAIARASQPSEVIRNLWSANALERIAQPNAQRPDTLQFGGEQAASDAEPCRHSILLRWPREGLGYLMIDGSVRELQRLYPSPENFVPPKKSFLRRCMASLLLLALFGGVFACWGGIRAFFRDWIINPICSLLGWEENAPSASLSPEKQDSEGDEALDPILDAVREALGTESDKLSEGLAVLLWISETERGEWDSKRFVVSEDNPTKGNNGLLAELKREEWSVTERKERHALVDVEDLGKKLTEILKRGKLTIDEDQFALKFGSKEQLDEVSDKMAKIEINSLILSIERTNDFKDEESLKNSLKGLLESAKEKDSYGYLAFFYKYKHEVKGREPYKLLCVNLDPGKGWETVEYLASKRGSGFGVIDRSRLVNLMRGKEKSQDGPEVEFHAKRHDIAFFLGRPDKALAKDKPLEQCLEVFLTTLISGAEAR